jgi:hypothetical protein
LFATLFGEAAGAAKLQGEELLVEPDLAAVLAFRVLGEHEVIGLAAAIANRGGAGLRLLSTDSAGAVFDIR